MGFDTGILLYLKYFGVRHSGLLSVLEVFRDPVLLILEYSTAFWHLVLLILSILEYFRISYCEVQ